MARLSKAFNLNEIRPKRAQSIQIRLPQDLMTKSLSRFTGNFITLLQCRYVSAYWVTNQLEQSFALQNCI